MPDKPIQLGVDVPVGEPWIDREAMVEIPVNLAHEIWATISRRIREIEAVDKANWTAADFQERERLDKFGRWYGTAVVGDAG